MEEKAQQAKINNFKEKQKESNKIKYYSSDSRIFLQTLLLSTFLIIFVGVILLDSFLDYSPITGRVISVEARETISLSSDLALLFIVVLVTTYILVRISQRES